MKLFDIELDFKNKPELEDSFIPVMLWNKAYLARAREPFIIALTGRDDACMVYRTKIHNNKEHFYADRFYLDRLVKSLLWIYGGYKISITGSNHFYEYLSELYSPTGARQFDVNFMSDIYGQPFTVQYLPAPPKEQRNSRFLARHLNGHRIGLDAGGNEKKVVAVSNGKIVYTEEVLWRPIEESDPDYHYQQVMDSLLAAAKKMPKIDAIGISSAGIFADNKACVASLFQSVDKEDFEESCRDLYLRAAKAMGCDRLEVVNDGEVTALAGAMNMDANSVLGLSMDAGLGGGFIDEKGNLTGWINELGFAPITFDPNSAADQWSLDKGCGTDYFSQRGIIRLARAANMYLDERASELENFRAIQVKAAQGDRKATRVFNSVGTMLGHTLAYYHSFYHFQFVLLLGRVMNGPGGDLIFNSVQKVLVQEYPAIASNIVISQPDENNDKVERSMAAASLPEC